MERRSRTSKPVKSQGYHASGQKPREAPTRRPSTADLQRQLDDRTRERDEALEQQAATAEVLSVMSRSKFDLEPVLQSVIHTAVKLCRADQATISRLDGDVYRFAAGYSLVPEYLEIEHATPIVPGPGTVVGRAAMSRAVARIDDAMADPLYEKKKDAGIAQIRSMIGVPLMRDGEPIGVIALARCRVEPFSDREIELVTTFADQAVIAIENVRLFDEVQARTRDLTESLEQQTATSEVLKVISSSPGELKPVFTAILENATRICEAKFGVLYHHDDGSFDASAMHNVPNEFANFLIQRGPFVAPEGSPLDRIFKTRRLVHTVDEAAQPMPSGPARFGGARSLVAVPMLKESTLVGAFIIYRQEVRPFTEKQIELVQNFAAQAVIAIENTRLLNELRESLEQQTATSEVLKIISSSPGDLEPVFNAMLESATRMCGAKFGNLLLSDGEVFRRAAMHNAPQALVEHHARNGIIHPNSAPALRRLVLTKEVIHVADIAAEFPDAVIRLGNARTVLLVPMLKENKLIGVFGIYRQEVHPFTDKQIELVQNFADQAVIAIENARLLNELRQRTDDLSESLEQQTATSEVLRVISSSPGALGPVFQAILENATRICNAKFGNLLLVEGDAFRNVALYGAPEAFAEERRREPIIHPPPGSDLDQIRQSKKTLHISDIADRRARAATTAIVRLARARAFLNVPMIKDDELIGVIGIYRQEVLPFTEKQIELVQSFAAQAVIAIENARLLNELRQRTDELSKSLEDLRTTQDRLVQTEKLASLGQLTAGIAHEIKNPLNFVNNFSGVSTELIDELQEALTDVSLNEKKHREITELVDTLRGNLDKVVQHGKRADAIVKNMLLHSRQGSAEHRPMDINALVEESLNLAYHGARAEQQGFNITLEKSLDPSAGEVDVFPQDVTRVLLNLISNGFYAATKRKAQADGGDYEPTLMAATRNLGGSVEITIRDNGTGIPPEVKEQMFNPFFTTKPAGEGTGLGLSISHDIIVKQHGGSIEVDTQPGSFTEFKIILARKAATLGEGENRYEPADLLPRQ